MNVILENLHTFDAFAGKPIDSEFNTGIDFNDLVLEINDLLGVGSRSLCIDIVDAMVKEGYFEVNPYGVVYLTEKAIAEVP